MSETRKLVAILVADVVGYSRLAGADEDRTLARLRGLRSDLIDPAIAAHHGRIVKRTGDGSIIEFRSVVDAVRCAIEVQSGMVERNAGLPPERRIEFRIGVHLGDVVEESDGDLMGDGVNIAARLEGIAKPGAICLSEDAYRQVKQRLDLKVTDLGATQLKNITEPVRVYSLELGQPAGTKPVLATTAAVKPENGTLARRASDWSSRWPALAAAIAALLLLGAGGWTLLGGRLTKPAQAAHLSIVVLPFANLSGDPSQDYFADGVTENLTTELSRIKDSFVIARNTAFTYKGKSVDAKEIGKELGVRYVLEGSVQRDQNRVRVNAQLVDAETGAHLWADRFEEDIADLFKLQDQVVARLANALGYELIRAEAERGSRSANPDAIDLSMHGWTLIWRGYQQPPTERQESKNEARALFDRALQIDPNNADCLAGSAYTYFLDYVYGWGDPGTDYEAKVLGQADRAIILAPDNVRGYCVKGFYLSESRRAREGLAAAEAGLAINPNFVMLFAPRVIAELGLGHFEQAKADSQRAMRLSPRDPLTGFFHLLMGEAELGVGRTDAAIDQYNQALNLGFRTYSAYAHLSAAYALAGKMDEAQTALAEARRLNPKLTVKWM
ncbi:MAG: adenylate/guanylate cyclase domain-containing protein, partial [Roseiarcus sp.]|uniref:adenylate/guanylate cyclase domain-containing protein n=1 Tax=Roseiarcus sp. TaxID=1969460 RepID=UPI003C5FA860